MKKTRKLFVRNENVDFCFFYQLGNLDEVVTLFPNTRPHEVDSKIMGLYTENP